MPPTPDEIQDARRRESIGRPPDTGLARGPETPDPRTPQGLRPIYSVVLLFVLVLVVTLILALWPLA
ncbi:hypothetical protein QFZ27_006212 [Inquilinus ginsengisoli]|uniref:hypothetical protein n=1 Tax=Inquilinus ginsengisoli TaxID=363840 RepID=UPI003D1B9D1F